MKKCIKPLLLVVLFTFVFTLGQNSVYAHHPYEEFNHENLIDNLVFRDTNTMNASSIQSFLNSKNGHIAGYTHNQPGHNDHGKTAAQIIHKYAQEYGINPQVIIATLQKEQSLITVKNPHESQYRSAMGYACPTTGTCDPKYAGFANQVIHGVWQLRFNFERANGNNSWWSSSISYVCTVPPTKSFYNKSLLPGSTVGFTNSSGSSPYRVATLANAATASLYCYTPHAYSPDWSGSHNFVVSFENWFGSTQGTPFFRIDNTAPVYILGASNDYYHVPSMDVLKAYGYGTNINRVVSVDESYIEGLSNSGKLPLIARFEGAPIYLIDDGRKHHFKSSTIFQDVFGYDFGDEAKLPENLQYYFSTGSSMREIVRERGGSPVYLIEDGKKRHIIDREAYDSGSPAYSSRSRVSLSKLYLSTLTNGPSVIAPNKLISYSNKDNYAYWDGNELQEITKETIKSMGVRPDYTIRFNSVSGLALSVNSPIDILAKSTTGELFLMDNSKKLLVNPSDLDSLGFSSDDFKQVTSNRFLNLVKTERLSTAVRVNNGSAIFMLKDGKRYHFNDWAAIKENGYSSSNITRINSRTAGLFPNSGGAILSTGTLFRIGNTAKVYLVNDLNQSLDVPSRAIFEQYGLPMSEVISLKEPRVLNYSSVGDLGHFIKDDGGSIWMIHGGKYRTKLSAAMTGANVYNLNSNQLPNLKNSLINDYTLRSDLNPSIIRASNDSKVYLIEEGKKRWVTSRSIFESMGHSFSEVTEVADHFLNSLPNGPNIE